MSFTKTLHSLGVGDIVQTRRTLRVTDAFANGVQLEDVATGETFTCADRDHGTLQLNVVLKAAPEVKPVKVGDKVTHANVAYLPEGAAVVSAGQLAAQKYDDSLWSSADPDAGKRGKAIDDQTIAGWDATVVYLP